MKPWDPGWQGQSGDLQTTCTGNAQEFGDGFGYREGKGQGWRSVEAVHTLRQGRLALDS